MKSNQESALRIILGSIPYAGPTLVESIFDRRSRIKQERVNKFIEDLSNFFKKNSNQKIDDEFIKTDDFGDLFETILRKISETKSQEKIDRFRLVLTNQMSTPSFSEFTETFIELISKLNENQIIILAKHHELKSIYPAVEANIKSYKSEKRKLEDEIKELTEKFEKGMNIDGESLAEKQKKLAFSTLDLHDERNKKNELDQFRESTFYSLNKGDYLFFIQDLVSKSLLRELGGGEMGYIPFMFMEITEFGSKLLNFIVNKQSLTGQTDQV
jgi:hypothetical protein